MWGDDDKEEEKDEEKLGESEEQGNTEEEVSYQRKKYFGEGGDSWTIFPLIVFLQFFKAIRRTLSDKQLAWSMGTLRQTSDQNELLPLI